MFSLVFLLWASASTSLLVEAAAVAQQCKCKCGPDEACWPTDLKWNELNTTTGGKLIKSEPLAQSCYPGPGLDLANCAAVDENWFVQSWQTSQPLGLPYPWNITCAPVNYTAGETPGSCSLGQNPRYIVNATSTANLKAALQFAQENNIRLVVKGTGHDAIGRSDGYGSLEIYLRHYLNGITFQPTYQSINQCTKSGWSGSAMHIDGNYVWHDVALVAQEHGVIVVSGGTSTVGAIGGWPSGGGHGPGTHYYGLGADHILEATVMLADGRIVTANACENQDLFRAIRGGGPGYGITLSSTVKAHPNTNAVAVQYLSISLASSASDDSELLDAFTAVYSAYPDLVDAGYAGYGSFLRAAGSYSHTFNAIGKTIEEIRLAFDPVRSKLALFNQSLVISEAYAYYPDYWSYYGAESGGAEVVGIMGLSSSRLIDRPSLENSTKVRSTLEVIAGAPKEQTSIVLALVSGGQVWKDAQDPYSGLNPAWRKSHFMTIIAQVIPTGTNDEGRKAIENKVTFVKGAALKQLAPSTGGYMNEGDRNDPDYIETFYGPNYASHLSTKQKYDPSGVFYCPTCVGAEFWVEKPDSPLCRL